jgi:hypothetical protein
VFAGHYRAKHRSLLSPHRQAITPKFRSMTSVSRAPSKVSKGPRRERPVVRQSQYGETTVSIFSRFFGRKEADDSAGEPLVANPDIKHPLSLQVLFPDAWHMDCDRLAEALRSYHSSMSGVRCEIDPELMRDGRVFGMVGWGMHVIRLVGFDVPYPADILEACVAPSHYPQELKQRARSHKAHVILYYAGREASPFEQYIALAATAGVLARLGAIVILNESGHTSFPAAALSGSDCEGDIMDLLRELPLSILYCGFVKHEVEGIPGVWMRTYGAPLLGLPNFAAHASGHQEAQRYFDIFESIFRYLRETGARLAEKDTLQIDEEEYLRFRASREGEEFLARDAELLVVEPIRADEVNR